MKSPLRCPQTQPRLLNRSQPPLPRHQPSSGASRWSANINQAVRRSHVRQSVGNHPEIPTFWRTWLRRGPIKKARCLCDTGLLKAPVGKSIRCHCLRRYGCEFIWEIHSIFSDGRPTRTAGTSTAAAKRLHNPNRVCRPCSLVVSSFCQPRLTIFVSRIPGKTPGSSAFSIGHSADQLFIILVPNLKKRTHSACVRTICQTAAACQHLRMTFFRKNRKDISAPRAN